MLDAIATGRPVWRCCDDMRVWYSIYIISLYIIDIILYIYIYIVSKYDRRPWVLGEERILARVEILAKILTILAKI